jgi:hypothetical protein
VYLLRTLRVIGEVLGSFLNFKKDDGLLAKSGKVANIAVRRAAYFAADYYLAAMSAGVVAGAKYLGLPFVGVFAAIWVFDTAVAATFLAIYLKTDEDLSLGVDYRRAVDTLHQKSRWAGYGAVAMFVFQALFWTGPEQVVTFFRKEIGTIPRMISVMLVLTAVQSVFWAIVYGFGYDLVVKWWF